MFKGNQALLKFCFLTYSDFIACPGPFPLFQHSGPMLISSELISLHNKYTTGMLSNTNVTSVSVFNLTSFFTKQKCDVRHQPSVDWSEIHKGTHNISGDSPLPLVLQTKEYKKKHPLNLVICTTECSGNERNLSLRYLY